MNNNNPPSPEKIRSLQGNVVPGIYGMGSKSEQEAIFLDTGSKKYLLRRKSGAVLGDVELKKYLGCRVECTGFLLGDTLLAESINIIK